MKKTSGQQHARSVVSSQQGIHERLHHLVEKHLHHPFKKPYAQHNIDAFNKAQQWLSARDRPLILDSFCGVGESTWRLAKRFPDHLVIGIDKSAARLDKHPAHIDADSPNNYLLVRADIDDFWRLAAAADWRPEFHFLLYPNPWPKPGQLSLRVHGSPLFSSLLELGGHIEARSNWPIYIQELAAALRIARQNPRCETFSPGEPLTPFERKYLAAGQPLWRCQCQLEAPQALFSHRG
ncbi:SAM-dependent methyltransferase [Spongiibacter sp. KMU-166]|uniref:tRNA (guanine(46)-N(7))-methyltransferase n=1 Tax=Spongiibacter thalassae TaxID=2721624 RepID=A0ABX1GKL6_9GAMM|nr:SAM-dependent methyltransferase [Spongiibacter thalassae]NKI19511.1 SAM-dependent methyltransferase [Spongiibacter thalassae]